PRPGASRRTTGPGPPPASRPQITTTEPDSGGKPNIAGIDAMSSSGEEITTCCRSSPAPSSPCRPVVVIARPPVRPVACPHPRTGRGPPAPRHRTHLRPPRSPRPAPGPIDRPALWRGTRGWESSARCCRWQGGETPYRGDDGRPSPRAVRAVVTRGAEMARHSDLYTLIEPVPDLRSESGQGPVLVHGLEGFSDAGQAIQGATEHLREHLDAQLIAEFDADELVDYRSRRPHLRYSFDHFTGYDEPAIRIHAVKDTDGTPFLLLSGLEPDLRWDRFTESVIDLCEAFGVRMSVGLGAMPLAVPPTRPTHSSAHASDVDLIRGFTAWPGEFAVPGNAGSLLELRMSEHGIPSAGFTVHVPQYLAQTTYPAAVLDLVGNVAEIADLQLPTGSLESAAASFTEQVDSQIADSPEVLNAVEMMEKQFDQFMESRHGSDSLNPGGKPLPSGDEIGAEFERFLAEQSDDEGPSAG